MTYAFVVFLFFPAHSENVLIDDYFGGFFVGVQLLFVEVASLDDFSLVVWSVLENILHEGEDVVGDEVAVLIVIVVGEGC